MKLPLVIFSSLTLIAACTTHLVAPKVDAAIVGLTTAEGLAVIYTKLPRCAVAATKVCSDEATVTKIKDLDMKAYNAVKAAEKNEAMLDFAWSAIVAFQTAIPTQGK